MENYIGEIRLFGGSYAPQGWALCNGQQLPIAGNDALYSLLGTTYGGNGTTTFGLPDFQGRLPIGQGTGTGLTARALGQKGGTETVTLDQTMIPSHNHTLNVSTAAGTTSTPGSNMVLATSASGSGFYDNNDQTPSVKIFSPHACSTEGGNSPHDNIMPSTCVSFIIATQGLYPNKP